MRDSDCTAFLQSCLPRLRLRWPGFRRVRKQVCKRLGRRIDELGLSGLPAYRDYLDTRPEEWKILDGLCRITITRFYRDRGVFDALRFKILPALGEKACESGTDAIRCWCAGCCSGEEAYTLQILWKIDVLPRLAKRLPLRIVATDMDSGVLERARKGIYPESSLADLPKEWIPAAFSQSGATRVIREPFREDITFVRQDVRRQLPEGTFSLILCRNLVLTYFEESLQREILEKLFERLEPGGIFVVGIHESIPEGVPGVVPYDHQRGIYQKKESP